MVEKLVALGMPGYVDKFAGNDVDASVPPKLTDQDLKAPILGCRPMGIVAWLTDIRLRGCRHGLASPTLHITNRRRKLDAADPGFSRRKGYK